MKLPAGLLATVALVLSSLACGDETTERTKEMSALRQEMRTRTASLLKGFARSGLRPVFASGEYYSCSADEADSLVKRYEWSYRVSGRVNLSSATAAEVMDAVRTVVEEQGWSITRADVLANGRRGVAGELHGLRLGVGLYEGLPGEALLIRVDGPCLPVGESEAARYRRVGAEDIETPR